MIVVKGIPFQFHGICACTAVCTERAEVQFEYQAENDDELCLKVGDIITNVLQAEEGWMEGTLNGKRGVFPDNFVKVLPPEESAPVPDGGEVVEGVC